MIGIKSRLNRKSAAPMKANFNRSVSPETSACWFGAASHFHKTRSGALTNALLPGIKLRGSHIALPAKAGYALPALLSLFDQSRPLRFRFRTAHSHTESFHLQLNANKMRFAYRSRFNGVFAEGFGCLCGKGYLSSEYACHDSRSALIGDAYASRCRSKSELRAKGKGRCSCRPGNKATARQESSSYTCNVKCKRDSISVALESLP